jgi:structure-specific recognition protein 1
MSELELILCRELLESRYKDKLEPRYEEPIHQVVTKIFRGLSGKKVIMPSKDFVRSVIFIVGNLPDLC